MPNESILQVRPNSTELKVAPFRYRIYNITTTSYNPHNNESVYPSAVDFLSTQLKVKPPTNSVCNVQAGNLASQFCIYPEYGYIFTSTTFVPGLHIGDSYDVGLIIRDYSPVPFIGKTRVRISVVPQCFPMQRLYNETRSLCPSDYCVFSFPSNLTWSNAYRKALPVSITSPIKIARIFINTNLLVGFRRDNSYWEYEISFAVSGTTFRRNFTYVPSTLDFKVGQVIQTFGTEFNIVILPPIEVPAGESTILVSLKLLNYNGGTEIEFNNQNAIFLHGTSRISKCPDSSCMNAYRLWRNAIEKLRYSQNFQCISDETLQEVYLQPCNSEFTLHLSYPVQFH